jgi:cell division protein FtsL
MRIPATFLASALTLASAYTLYSESAATRRLEIELQAKERHRERLESDIAVLRAERAFLARPSRIEPAAKDLGMTMPRAGDHLPLSVVTGGSPVDPILRPR